MSADKAYLSLEEVAELLGVHYQLIYRLVRSGELRAARIGRVYRVQKDDLDRYIESAKSPRPATDAGVCSACGRTYQSELSLKNGCLTCGAPLCLDCWDRLGRRQCDSHQAKT